MGSFIKKQKASIPRRLHLLFFIIVFLVTSLILRLAYMQIYDHQFYLSKLNATTLYHVRESKPRGSIFDREGKALVTNNDKEVVTFTRSPKASVADIKVLANRLAQFMELPQLPVSTRSKKDYYLADPKVYAKVVDRSADKEKTDRFGNRLTQATIYQNALASVKEKDLVYSQDQLKVIAVFNQMNATASFNTVKLKTEPLTDYIKAYIQANQSQLKGIWIGSDWEREVRDTSLTSIIGKISSREAGLPKEEADAYLKKGYALNDRVGTSYLEKQYEDLLQGKPVIKQIKINKSGKKIAENTTDKGTSGSNLKLTISLDFQEAVEGILENHYQAELANGQAKYSDGIYAVALNPQTGAILAMTGLSHNPENDHLQKDALGTITDTVTPGSVVKGATIIAGWQSGVIEGNQILTDQPIQFGNAKPIQSWFTAGLQNISAQQALEYSSNTYMVQVALKMMGQDYHTGMTLTSSGMKEAMGKLRETFASFGLGVPTGIDLPGESAGYLASDYDMSAVLGESFGQFDNYTTMQLAQYVSTIANGGNRIAPHLVQEIYHSKGQEGFGTLTKTIEPKVLNKVVVSQDQLAIIQNGFYQVVNSQSPYATGRELSGGLVSISAKTGTAETFAKDKEGHTIETFNLNVVAYGPSQTPEIAVAVMYPKASQPLAKAHQQIAKEIINLYMTDYVTK